MKSKYKDDKLLYYTPVLKLWYEIKNKNKNKYKYQIIPRNKTNEYTQNDTHQHQCIKYKRK